MADCHNRGREATCPWSPSLVVLAAAVALTIGGRVRRLVDADRESESRRRWSDVRAECLRRDAVRHAAPRPSRPKPVPDSSGPAVIADVPIVPVTQFRTTVERTGRDEVAAVLAGTSKTCDALELVDGEADAILAGARGRTGRPTRSG